MIATRYIYRASALSIGGKALFADEKVPVNELLALDLNKQVIGVLTLATVNEVAGEKS